MCSSAVCEQSEQRRASASQEKILTYRGKMACYYKFFEKNWIIDSQEIVHSTQYSTCNFFGKKIHKTKFFKEKSIYQQNWCLQSWWPATYWLLVDKGNFQLDIYRCPVLFRALLSLTCHLVLTYPYVDCLRALVFSVSLCLNCHCALIVVVPCVTCFQDDFLLLALMDFFKFFIFIVWFPFSVVWFFSF